MSVRWRDIRATIEGKEIISTTQHGRDITPEVCSGSNEEREGVLDWVDELCDIETVATEEYPPGETTSFELESYVNARYLDILSLFPRTPVQLPSQPVVTNGLYGNR